MTVNRQTLMTDERPLTANVVVNLNVEMLNVVNRSRDKIVPLYYAQRDGPPQVFALRSWLDTRASEQNRLRNQVDGKIYKPVVMTCAQNDRSDVISKHSQDNRNNPEAFVSSSVSTVTPAEGGPDGKDKQNKVDPCDATV